MNSPTNGQSCEEHRICGEVVIEDVVLHLRKVQVQMNQQEQSTIAAFWVSDGIDRCRCWISSQGVCQELEAI